MNNCEYFLSGKCILTNNPCRKKNENSIKKCVYANKVKEKVYSEDIYRVQKNVSCKHCGCTSAYQYIGKLYPEGLPKETILKYPNRGKYYNQPYISNAVGFGGTIPYHCPNCGAVGLIDMALEGYEAVFTDLNSKK